MSDLISPDSDMNSSETESPEQDDNIEAVEELSLDELNEWGGSDLEAAYLKALSALDASESEMPDVSAGDTVEFKANDDSATNPDAKSPLEIAMTASTRPASHQSVPHSVIEQTTNDVARVPVATSGSSGKEVEFSAEVRPVPRQIIEACLFVGGDALTSTKLSGVLRGEFDSDFIEREIDELNRAYAAECRPYEIRLGEGGYRLALRAEFERVRHKVYGFGPREVRLSQDALEVLAVVAYHQPIKQAQVEELGKPGCGAVLRQLVRRELIAVERDSAQPREVNYKTTPRFLSLFGIRNLDELPRHEQVSYK